MPHRGRLNVLANILDKPYGMLFNEFEGDHLPETVGGDGDVKYHLGFSADHVTADKHTIHLSLSANPSHLEAVNPVVEGRMRAKQRRFKDKDRRLGMPVLIHGDAAFAGQGLVAETLNLSQLPGYRTGGTIHIVVNNQIGFTTPPSEGRSTRYCTDVAKMIEVPIFHVNGEDPEAVVSRRRAGVRFPADVRPGRRDRHGLLPPPRPQRGRRAGVHPADHVREDQESDQHPRALHRAARDGRRALQRGGRDDRRDVRREDAAKSWTKSRKAPAEPPAQPRIQRGLDGPVAHATRSRRWKPASPSRRCERSPRRVRRSRRDFTSIPSSRGCFAGRVKTLEAKESLDWAFAEIAGVRLAALAKTPRSGLSGQDSRRGTFSQRHAVLVDYQDRRALYAARTISRRARPSSASTTACSPRPPCSGSTTAIRSTSRTC